MDARNLIDQPVNNDYCKLFGAPNCARCLLTLLVTQFVEISFKCYQETGELVLGQPIQRQLDDPSISSFLSSLNQFQSGLDMSDGLFSSPDYLSQTYVYQEGEGITPQATTPDVGLNDDAKYSNEDYGIAIVAQPLEQQHGDASNLLNSLMVSQMQSLLNPTTSPPPVMIAPPPPSDPQLISRLQQDRSALPVMETVLLLQIPPFPPPPKGPPNVSQLLYFLQNRGQSSGSSLRTNGLFQEVAPVDLPPFVKPPLFKGEQSILTDKQDLNDDPRELQPSPIFDVLLAKNESFQEVNNEHNKVLENGQLLQMLSFVVQDSLVLDESMPKNDGSSLLRGSFDVLFQNGLYVSFWENNDCDQLENVGSCISALLHQSELLPPLLEQYSLIDFLQIANHTPSSISTTSISAPTFGETLQDDMEGDTEYVPTVEHFYQQLYLTPQTEQLMIYYEPFFYLFPSPEFNVDEYQNLQDELDLRPLRQRTSVNNDSLVREPQSETYYLEENFEFTSLPNFERPLNCVDLTQHCSFYLEFVPVPLIELLDQYTDPFFGPDMKKDEVLGFERSLIPLPENIFDIEGHEGSQHRTLKPKPEDLEIDFDEEGIEGDHHRTLKPKLEVLDLNGGKYNQRTEQDFELIQMNNYFIPEREDESAIDTELQFYDDRFKIQKLVPDLELEWNFDFHIGLELDKGTFESIPKPETKSLLEIRFQDHLDMQNLVALAPELQLDLESSFELEFGNNYRSKQALEVPIPKFETDFRVSEQDIEPEIEAMIQLLIILFSSDIIDDGQFKASELDEKESQDLQLDTQYVYNGELSAEFILSKWSSEEQTPVSELQYDKVAFNAPQNLTEFVHSFYFQYGYLEGTNDVELLLQQRFQGLPPLVSYPNPEFLGINREDIEFTVADKKFDERIPNRDVMERGIQYVGKQAPSLVEKDERIQPTQEKEIVLMEEQESTLSQLDLEWVASVQAVIEEPSSSPQPDFGSNDIGFYTIWIPFLSVAVGIILLLVLVFIMLKGRVAGGGATLVAAPVAETVGVGRQAVLLARAEQYGYTPPI